MSWEVWVSLYVLLESLFYLLLWLWSRRWQRPLCALRGDFPRAPRFPEDILKMVEHHMCRSRKDAEDFISNWHFGTPLKQIQRKDVEDFLAWSFFTRRRSELTQGEVSLITDCLERVEEKVGIVFGRESSLPGHPASSQKFAAHTWESDCGHHHFPLIVYLFMFAVKRIIGTPCLLLLGFRYRKQGVLRYWIRERDWSCARRSRAGPPEEVLLFFHGICPGLTVYLQYLMRFRHQTVILFELNWVTFNPLCTTVPTRDDFCNSVVDTLEANEISRVCLSAHSYGSFMVAWLLHCPRLSGKITRTVLVSPPALNLFIAKTCKIVCYDKPFWFDYTLAHVFFRQFYWHHHVLTASDLPEGSTVVLSEHDELIPVSDVVRDCEEHRVRCYVEPSTKHAFEIVYPMACAKIVRFIRQGQGEPLNNDNGVRLFFHSARSSKLYSQICEWCLPALDAISSLIVMRGHSPFNLPMLLYLDELWPGGMRSWSQQNLKSYVKDEDDDEGKIQ